MGRTVWNISLDHAFAERAEAYAKEHDLSKSALAKMGIEQIVDGKVTLPQRGRPSSGIDEPIPIVPIDYTLTPLDPRSIPVPHVYEGNEFERVCGWYKVTGLDYFKPVPTLDELPINPLYSYHAPQSNS